MPSQCSPFRKYIEDDNGSVRPAYCQRCFKKRLVFEHRSVSPKTSEANSKSDSQANQYPYQVSTCFLSMVLVRLASMLWE